MSGSRTRYAWPLVAICGLFAGAGWAQDDDAFEFDEGALEDVEPPEEEAPAPEPEAPAEQAPEAGAADQKEEDEEAKEEISEEGLNLTLEDRIKAVSRKTFIKAGRFTAVPMLAASTNDAFYQHFGVGGRLSWHLVDSLALDVGGIWIPQPYGTIGLPTLRVVREQYEAVANVADLYGYADVGITFSPIYGKFAIMGDWIIHFDGFLSGGIGAAIDTNRYAVPVLGDLPEWFPGINPAAEVGLGFRVFVFRWMTLRFDVRDYVYPQHRLGIASLQNLVMVQAGLGFYFPFDFEYEYAAAKVVDG